MVSTTKSRKIIDQFQIENFSSYPSQIIECLSRKSAWQPIFDSSQNEAEHTNNFVCVCFYTFWIEGK